MPTQLPIGFDLDWDLYPTDNKFDMDLIMFAIRGLQQDRELQELCPSEDVWHFLARTEKAQRLLLLFADVECINLIYPNTES